MSTNAWSPGQRALLRLLEREGLLPDPPVPPAADETPADALLFAAIADAVPPRMLAELLAARLHLPLVDERGVLGDPAVATMLSVTVASRCGAVPLGLAGESLEVAIANPLDLDAVKTIEFATGRRVRLHVATLDEVRRGLADLYGVASEADVARPAAPAVEPYDPPEPATTAEPLPPIASESASTPETPEPVCRRRRLLVVAPDADRRGVLGRALAAASEDWLVTTAADAAEGMMLATVVAPDVVIVEAPAAVYDALGGDAAIAGRLIAAAGDPTAVVDAVRTLLENGGGIEPQDGVIP